jgi:hypothetical protein
VAGLGRLRQPDHRRGHRGGARHLGRRGGGRRPEEELRAAKTYITGEYPLRFDGNAEIAGILVGMQMVGPAARLRVNRNSYIEAVTIEDIRRVAAELMDPEALHVVVVGQPEGLEGGRSRPRRPPRRPRGRAPGRGIEAPAGRRLGAARAVTACRDANPALRAPLGRGRGGA